MAPLPVLDAFAGSVVLVTGGLGFLGKVLVWMLLKHSSPAKIYILCRGKTKRGKHYTAKQRFCADLLDNPIFGSFTSDERSTLVPIEGDCNKENLGLSDAEWESCMGDVNFLFHCAASVKFDSPILNNFASNTQAALRALELSQKCKHLKAHVHVSTTFVNCNTFGNSYICERLYPTEIDCERLYELIMEAKRVVEHPASTAKTRKFIAEKLLALQGSHPNSYTFTKSLTERLLVRRIEPNFPLCIVRPAIIGAAVKYPRPGWADAVLATGAFIVFTALGVISRIPGSLEAVIDNIPVDYVCSAILAAGAAVASGQAQDVIRLELEESQGLCPRWRYPSSMPKARKEDDLYPGPSFVSEAEKKGVLILHSATSDTNPLGFQEFIQSATALYKRTRPVKSRAFIAFVRDERAFKLVHRLAKQLPLRLSLRAVNFLYRWTGLCKGVQDSLQLWNKALLKAEQFSNTFVHFTANEFIYETKRLRFLMNNLDDVSQQRLLWDSHKIDWWQYMDEYATGIFEYTLGEVPPVPLSEELAFKWDAMLNMSSLKYHDVYTDDLKAHKLTQRLVVHATIRDVQSSTSMVTPPALLGTRGNSESRSPRVEFADADDVDSGLNVYNEDDDQFNAYLAFLKWTSSSFNPLLMVGTTWITHALIGKIFQHVTLDFEGVRTLKKMSFSLPNYPSALPNIPTTIDFERHRIRNPVLIIPSHKSYWDFFLLSHACLAFGVRLPMVAADKVFASKAPFSQILRSSGAFFVQRNGPTADTDRRQAELGARSRREKKLLRWYIRNALLYHGLVQFFIEGSRNRGGPIRSPRLGLLSYALSLFEEGQIDTLRILPVGINYLKVIEEESLSKELVGFSKTSDSRTRVINSVVQFRLPTSGRVDLNVGNIITITPQSVKRERLGGIDPLYSPRGDSTEKMTEKTLFVTPKATMRELTDRVGFADRAATALAMGRSDPEEWSVVTGAKEHCQRAEALAWRVTYALQNLRRLTPREILAWALCFDSQVTFHELIYRVRSVLELCDALTMSNWHALQNYHEMDEKPCRCRTCLDEFKSDRANKLYLDIDYMSVPEKVLNLMNNDPAFSIIYANQPSRPAQSSRSEVKCSLLQISGSEEEASARMNSSTTLDASEQLSTEQLLSTASMERIAEGAERLGTNSSSSAPTGTSKGWAHAPKGASLSGSSFGLFDRIPESSKYILQKLKAVDVNTRMALLLHMRSAAIDLFGIQALYALCLLPFEVPIKEVDGKTPIGLLKEISPWFNCMVAGRRLRALNEEDVMAGIQEVVELKRVQKQLLASLVQPYVWGAQIILSNLLRFCQGRAKDFPHGRITQDVFLTACRRKMREADFWHIYSILPAVDSEVLRGLLRICSRPGTWSDRNPILSSDLDKDAIGTELSRCVYWPPKLKNLV